MKSVWLPGSELLGGACGVRCGALAPGCNASCFCQMPLKLAHSTVSNDLFLSWPAHSGGGASLCYTPSDVSTGPESCGHVTDLEQELPKHRLLARYLLYPFGRNRLPRLIGPGQRPCRSFCS